MVLTDYTIFGIYSLPQPQHFVGLFIFCFFIRVVTILFKFLVINFDVSLVHLMLFLSGINETFAGTDISIGCSEM